MLQASEAELEAADWTIGDPLGYNDKRAEEFGDKRFAHMEGHVHNTKVRFAAFKDRNRSLTGDGIQLATVMAFSIQRAIAMHYRRCCQAEEAGQPIPQPAPVPDSVHWREAQEDSGGHDPPVELAA